MSENDKRLILEALDNILDWEAYAWTLSDTLVEYALELGDGHKDWFRLMELYVQAKEGS